MIMIRMMINKNTAMNSKMMMINKNELKDKLYGLTMKTQPSPEWESRTVQVVQGGVGAAGEGEVGDGAQTPVVGSGDRQLVRPARPQPRHLRHRDSLRMAEGWQVA